jgi:hypothetical protein
VSDVTSEVSASEAPAAPAVSGPSTADDLAAAYFENRESKEAETDDAASSSGDAAPDAPSADPSPPAPQPAAPSVEAEKARRAREGVEAERRRLAREREHEAATHQIAASRQEVQDFASKVEAWHAEQRQAFAAREAELAAREAKLKEQEDLFEHDPATWAAATTERKKITNEELLARMKDFNAPANLALRRAEARDAEERQKLAAALAEEREEREALAKSIAEEREAWRIAEERRWLERDESRARERVLAGLEESAAHYPTLSSLFTPEEMVDELVNFATSVAGYDEETGRPVSQVQAFRRKYGRDPRDEEVLEHLERKAQEGVQRRAGRRTLAEIVASRNGSASVTAPGVSPGTPQAAPAAAQRAPQSNGRASEADRLIATYFQERQQAVKGG